MSQVWGKLKTSLLYCFWHLITTFSAHLQPFGAWPVVLSVQKVSWVHAWDVLDLLPQCPHPSALLWMSPGWTALHPLLSELWLPAGHQVPWALAENLSLGQQGLTILGECTSLSNSFKAILKSRWVCLCRGAPQGLIEISWITLLLIRMAGFGYPRLEVLKKCGCLSAVTSCSIRKAPSAPGWSQEDPWAWQGDLPLCFLSQSFECAIPTYQFLNMNSYFKACPAAGRMRSALWVPRLHAAQCQLFSISRVGIFWGKKVLAFSPVHIHVDTVSGVDKFSIPS